MTKFFLFLSFSFALFAFNFQFSSCGSSSSGGGSSSSTTYTIGGTISGLIGTVILQNNSADDLSVTANGTFTFATALADAATYSVAAPTQPTNQTCTVSDGSGTVSGANVTSVTVACVDTYPRIFVTASTFTGNLGGVSGADSSCMSDANYPGAGTYKALISDGSTRIACTTANCGGGLEGTNWALAASKKYVRSDGATVISTTNPNKIFIYDLDNSFSSTQGLATWTGLVSDWTSVTDLNNCTKWTLTTTMGRKGTPTATTTKYIDDGNQNCSSTAYLLCVEQ